MKVYQKIAATIQTIENCINSGNHIWEEKHTDTLYKIEKEYFPHGSGFDGVVTLKIDDCKKDKILIYFEWHCMDDNGYYDGWLNFDLIISPSFDGFNMHIVWYRHNMKDKYKVNKYRPLLEDFFYDTWYSTLDQEYKEN